MKKYRSRKEVEAFKWNGENLPEELKNNQLISVVLKNGVKCLEIETPIVFQTTYLAHPGDYITVSKDGAITPYRADIFGGMFEEI